MRHIEDEVHKLVTEPQEWMVPRVHPNGFLQLDLDQAGQRRLHVWDSSLPRQGIYTPIHDHAFSFRSTVIRGQLTNHMYTVRSDESGGYEFWQRVKGEGEETTLRTSGERFLVTVGRIALIEDGEFYDFPAGAFHETTFQDGTVSVIEKQGYKKDHTPGVMVPVGEVPDNSFVRNTLDTQVLWALIHESLYS